MPSMYKVMPWNPEFTPQDLQGVIDNLIEENTFAKGDEAEDAAKCLIAGVCVGHDHLWKVADFSGVPVWKVKKFARNLRRNGIWMKNGMTRADWEHETEGYMAFILDCLVAIGHVKRAGKDTYAST